MDAKEEEKEEEKQRRARKMALYSGRRYEQLRQLGDESIKCVMVMVDLRGRRQMRPNGEDKGAGCPRRTGQKDEVG